MLIKQRVLTVKSVIISHD